MGRKKRSTPSALAVAATTSTATTTTATTATATTCSHSHDHGAASSSHGTVTSSPSTLASFGGVYGADEPDPEEAARLESEHFNEVVNAYRAYTLASRTRLLRMLKCHRSLPPSHKELVSGFANSISEMNERVAVNQNLIDSMLATFHGFGSESALDISSQPDLPTAPKSSDVGKVQSTLRQLVREWSAEGAAERAQCYGPIVEAVVSHFGPVDPTSNAPRPAVLTPGSGLGRLPWEFASRGYTSVGNEFNFFMLIASNFILNMSVPPNSLSVYPWIHQLSNQRSRAEQLREVLIPDVETSDLPNGTQFSMGAGDFVEVFGSSPGEFDCVATCFFIDTAKNFVEYVEAIATTLKEGGLWVNLGPLLWHYADMDDMLSVELTWEEVRTVIEAKGFEVTHEEWRKCGYCEDVASMFHIAYDCVFFKAVLRRPRCEGHD